MFYLNNHTYTTVNHQNHQFITAYYRSISHRLLPLLDFMGRVTRAQKMTYRDQH